MMIDNEHWGFGHYRRSRSTPLIQQDDSFSAVLFHPKLFEFGVDIIPFGQMVDEDPICGVAEVSESTVE
jgi:hypothetical protein